MANEEHLTILKRGVEVWNQWRKENPDLRPDLSQAHLSQATLLDINLRLVLLGDADLHGASLPRANLSGAELQGAKLSGANFFEAVFRGTMLHDADLRGANLFGADLSGAGLRSPSVWSASMLDILKASLRWIGLPKGHTSCLVPGISRCLSGTRLRKMGS
ncbi:MAG TPA: pentapeptide repeat-containing protein [Ktedonobacteraceae bacterium]|nr:pentapeptide repeat-containing protein [Ktedonobacteraceae bacterium]